MSLLCKRSATEEYPHAPSQQHHHPHCTAHDSGPSTSGRSGQKLQVEGRKRDLALSLAIDSKLRGCDVVSVRVDDVAPRGFTVDRATVRQKKTGHPVKFELTEHTRQAHNVLPSLGAAKKIAGLKSGKHP